MKCVCSVPRGVEAVNQARRLMGETAREGTAKERDEEGREAPWRGMGERDDGMMGWTGREQQRRREKESVQQKEESSGRKEEEYAPLWGACSRCVSMATRGRGGEGGGALMRGV